MFKQFKETINDYISKEQWYFIGATIVFVLLAVLFMGKVADIRLKELEYSLRDMNPERSASASLSLISRYQLLQKRLSGVTDTKEDFLAESESLAVAAGGLLANSKKPKETIIDRVAVSVVNAFSYFTGGKPVRDVKDEKGENILRVAFLYERKRDYKSAFKAYTSAVRYFKSDRKRLSYLYLHRGFCKALTNDKKQALKDLNLSYKLDPGGDTGRTAAALALFINNLQKKLEFVLKMENTTKKGELLYRLMSYDKAINTLTASDKTESDQKSLFYRGRSHEELGNTKKAIKDYKKVIAINRHSEWGIKANRRLYLLGAFYSSDKKLAEESKQNAILANDSATIEKTKVFQETTQIEKIATLEKDDEIKETLETIQETENEKEPEIEIEVEPISKTEVLPILEIASVQSTQDMADIEADIARIRRENEQKLAIEIIRKDGTLRQRRKKLISEKFDLIDRVKLEDGNIYYGVIDNESNAELTLLTVLGKLSIPADLIIKKDKVQPRRSFLDAPVKSINRVSLSATLPSKERRKLLNPASSRKTRRAILRSRFKVLDKLILQDGNQFYGVIYSKKNGQIRLITVLGMMKIPLKSIVSREKIKSEVALP